MRRWMAMIAAVVLVASLGGSSLAAGPSYRVNRLVGSFDFLDWDGSVAGHIDVNFKEPTYADVVPGRLDVTWVEGARFPYEQQPYGVDESHTVLTAGWFGPGTPNEGGIPFIETGASGSMCDFSAPWNAVCHDFTVVFQEDVDTAGTDFVAFFGSGEDGEFYLVGPGSFALTYAGPTGPEPEP